MRTRPPIPAQCHPNAVVWTSAALASFVFLLAPPDQGPALTAILWLLSLVFLGLPHGASDWFLYRFLYPEHSWKGCLLFLTGYCMVAALYVFALWNSPAPSFLVFMALSAWHWGSADSVAFNHNKPLWIFASLSRGAMVILCPVFFHPDICQAFFQAVGEVIPNSVVISPMREAVALALAVSLLGDIVSSLFAYSLGVSTKRESLGRTAETIGLVLLFYSVAPLAAAGIYFIFIHSLKHSFRLISMFGIEDKPTALLALIKFHGQAYLFVVPVILLLASWYCLSPESFMYLDEGLARYLLVIAALTFPHALFITCLDIKKTPQLDFSDGNHAI